MLANRRVRFCRGRSRPGHLLQRAADPLEHRALAGAFLTDLDMQIDEWMFAHATIADFAILPFVRQFAFIDKPWFDAQPWSALQAWLERYLASDRFQAIMPKYAKWVEGEAGIAFPGCVSC